MVVLLEIGDAAGDQVAAQLAARLKQVGLMTANGQNPGSLTAGHAATHDQHLFGAADGLIRHIPLPAGLGVHSTIQRGILLNTAHTALVARQARPDPIVLIGTQLIYVFWVRQQRTTQADDVTGTVSNAGTRHFRIVHAPSHQDGHINSFLHKLGILAIQALFLVHGRMVPPPGIIGAHIHI